MRSSNTKNIVVSSGKQICDLKLKFRQFHLCLDFTVGVIDDGQEHVEQNEEHNEDVENEEERSKGGMSTLKAGEVKVPQHGSHQSVTVKDKINIFF